METKAVVLVSGGLDSAVALFLARKRGLDTYALTFDYGQRHRKEIRCARRIAKEACSEFHVVKLHFPWKGSSLLDRMMKLPFDRSINRIKAGGVPSTYVPARNTVFLSIAASYAEAIGASFIFIGAHSDDSSNYPDCRKNYLEEFNKVIKSGTKRGEEGNLKVEFPLEDKTKKEIVELGLSLDVPFHLTWSCYRGGRKPCSRCDSCVLRAHGFKEAGLKDPLTD